MEKKRANLKGESPQGACFPATVLGGARAWRRAEGETSSSTSQDSEASFSSTLKIEDPLEGPMEGQRMTTKGTGGRTGPASSNPSTAEGKTPEKGKVGQRGGQAMVGKSTKMLRTQRKKASVVNNRKNWGGGSKGARRKEEEKTLPKGL